MSQRTINPSHIDLTYVLCALLTQCNHMLAVYTSLDEDSYNKVQDRINELQETLDGIKLFEIKV